MKIYFKNNKPFIEGVCLDDIINSYSTPFYIYSQKGITETYNKLIENLNSEIFFSVKANSNQAILKLLKSCGAGADVVSAGELERALAAGFNSEKIIFEGVGKSKNDIQYAINNNIRLINIESINELILVNSIGYSLNKKINIGIRLNPDIDGKTLDKISTGKKTDKFGINIIQLNEIITLIKSCENINLKGISCHIGSQIHDLSTFKDVFQKMKKIANSLSGEGLNIEYVDLGGGFGVNYEKDSDDLDLKELGVLVHSTYNDTPYKISFEPGRFLVARSGILMTKILTTKENGGINFLITDAGMHTLIRPSMYGAIHRVQAINNLNTKTIIYTIAGPICESSDILVKNINLPKQEIDNYLAILDVGAYGAVMASNYNSRGIPKEFLIFDDQYSIIRSQESITETIKRDIIPVWLKTN